MNVSYQALAQYGDLIELNVSTDSNELVKWIRNFDWPQYNPRKDVNRWGLSVTSLDGGITGIPDLDSLHEYNRENNTSYQETDFKEPTPVFNEQLEEVLKPWYGNYYRTHFLKLGPGGFFPPHRDTGVIDIDSFRLILPLKNVNPPNFNFVLEDKILHWKVGHLYFLNTAKMHYLFNCSFSDSYWLVINVKLNQSSVAEVLKRFSQR